MKLLQIYYSPASTVGGVATAAQTDNKKLVTTDTVFVSPDGGTTNEAFPAPSIEYDFCVDVSNESTLNSGLFLVRFTLDNGTGGSGNQVFDFQQDAGLDAGQSVNAVVHFGQFTNDDVNFTLSACIFEPSALEKPINCAGTFGFNPHMNTVASSDSVNSDSGNATKVGDADNANSGDATTGTSGNSANTDDSNGTVPSSGGTPKTDSEGFKLVDSGSWNDSSSFKYQGGQVMHFQVKNVNVLGTTIKIKSNFAGEKFSMVLPNKTVDLRFDCFGAEPMGWTFNISSDSDAFIVAWSLYSSWVTGDLPNK